MKMDHLNQTHLTHGNLDFKLQMMSKVDSNQHLLEIGKILLLKFQVEQLYTLFMEQLNQLNVKKFFWVN
jgi:hypothetical protein